MHSTESALFQFSNDLLLIADAVQGCSVLVLLIQWTIECYLNGWSTTALQWFVPYLSNRTFVVNMDGNSSNTALLSSGVPQGLILCPLLFSLYLLPLGQKLRKHRISWSSDLSQSWSWWFSVPFWLPWGYQIMVEVIIFGSPQTSVATSCVLGPLIPYKKPVVKRLAVFLTPT